MSVVRRLREANYTVTKTNLRRDQFILPIYDAYSLLHTDGSRISASPLNIVNIGRYQYKKPWVKKQTLISNLDTLNPMTSTFGMVDSLIFHQLWSTSDLGRTLSSDLYGISSFICLHSITKFRTSLCFSSLLRHMTLLKKVWPCIHSLFSTLLQRLVHLVTSEKPHLQYFFVSTCTIKRTKINIIQNEYILLVRGGWVVLRANYVENVVRAIYFSFIISLNRTKMNDLIYFHLCYGWPDV